MATYDYELTQVSQEMDIPVTKFRLGMHLYDEVYGAFLIALMRELAVPDTIRQQLFLKFHEQYLKLLDTIFHGIYELVRIKANISAPRWICWISHQITLLPFQGRTYRPVFGKKY